MAKYTEEQLYNAAKNATMYINEEGTYMRMQYTEQDYFVALDEWDNKEHTIYFSSIVDSNIKFMHLVETVIV